VLIGLGVNLVAAVVGYITGRAKGRREQAFNILNYGSFNIGAFTLPYISTFLGAKGVVMTCLFDVGNSIGAAGINYSIAKSLVDEEKKISIIGVAKHMLSSVIFDTYVMMFILRLLKFELPTTITTFTGIVGQANTFLAMLMIGIAFEIHIDRSRLRKVVSSLTARYVITIGLAIGIFFLSNLPLEGRRVLCIALFAPIAAMTSGFTEEIKGDLITSSFMTSLSTIISIVVITVLLALMP
jgi:predicted permease